LTPEILSAMLAAVIAVLYLKRKEIAAIIRTCKRALKGR
jgi:hypothetical protein